MTKKDYELIAKALYIEPSDRKYYTIGYTKAISNIILALQKDNPKFNKAKFLKEIGL